MTAETLTLWCMVGLYVCRFMQITLALRQDREEDEEAERQQAAADRAAQEKTTTFRSLLSEAETQLELPDIFDTKASSSSMANHDRDKGGLQKYKGKNRTDLLKASRDCIVVMCLIADTEKH